jgi:hypothetical protein
VLAVVVEEFGVEEPLEPVVRVAVVLEVIVALLLLQQERQIPAAVEVVLALPEVVAVYQAQVALALSSLKYLTTYPQHSLVALHRACPHLSLGSTSTL